MKFRNREAGPSAEKLTQRPGSIGNSGLANGKARSGPTAPALPFCGHIYGDVLVARSINGLDVAAGFIVIVRSVALRI